MVDQYNHLCQRGLIPEADFFFEQADDKEWVCRVTVPFPFSAKGAQKRNAKAQVCQGLVEGYQMVTEEPWQPPSIKQSVWVLVDADSLNNTLTNLAPWHQTDWLVVQGFANPATKLPEGLPWHVYRSERILPDSADHLLTWHTAQLVQTLSQKAFFIVVSRDAALQTTVELLQKTGHAAVFVPRDIKHLREVVELLKLQGLV